MKIDRLVLSSITILLLPVSPFLTPYFGVTPVIVALTLFFGTAAIYWLYDMQESMDRDWRVKQEEYLSRHERHCDNWKCDCKNI